MIMRLSYDEVWQPHIFLKKPYEYTDVAWLWIYGGLEWQVRKW